MPFVFFSTTWGLWAALPRQGQGQGDGHGQGQRQGKDKTRTKTAQGKKINRKTTNYHRSLNLATILSCSSGDIGILVFVLDIRLRRGRVGPELAGLLLLLLVLRIVRLYHVRIQRMNQ